MLTASLSKNACEYCVDGDGNWLSLAAGATTQSVNAGHTLSFRGNLTPTSSAGIGTFTISKKCNLEGHCMSMLFGDNAANNLSLAGKDNAFYKLFSGCTNIVEVSEGFLPATTLVTTCYSSMFSGCTSLNSITCLATNYKSGATGCTSGWVKNVAANGTFYKSRNALAGIWPTGVNGIPSGWTVINYN